MGCLSLSSDGLTCEPFFGGYVGFLTSLGLRIGGTVFIEESR